MEVPREIPKTIFQNQQVHFGLNFTTMQNSHTDERNFRIAASHFPSFGSASLETFAKRFATPHRK